MPSKRRQRGKGRGKSGRYKEISSEEMDSQPLEQSRKSKDKLTDIMDRLAKKRLLKSSTDTEVEQPELKENQRKQHGGDGYDADFETSELDSMSAGSDMDCQTQPNKSSDLRVVLSPLRGSNRRSAHSTQGNVQRKAVYKQGEKASVHGRNVQSLASESQENSMPEGRRQSKKKNCSTDSTGQPSTHRGGAASLLMSPEMIQTFALPKLNGSDSSTPLSAIADSKSDANESCFGFEGLLSPEQPLQFSPVLPQSPFPIDNEEVSPTPSPKLDVTPPPSPSPSLNLVLRLSPSPQHEIPSLSSTSSSLQSSLASSTSVSGMTSRGRQKRRLDINLTGLIPGADEEQGPPRKAVKKKKAIPKKKEADAWVMKMSAEFDDIEMFELTVE